MKCERMTRDLSLLKGISNMKEFDLIIIGGGPAGLSAAISAAKKGIQNIAVVDRLNSAGGMLTQCFHRGFGVGMYGEGLSGPEFISKMLSTSDTREINILTNSFVSTVEEDFTVNIVNEEGLLQAKPKAIIVATGCRETPIGSLDVYGSRPAGVFTAGSVQKMINLYGYKFGKRAIVLGSGDVGLIVSHHLTETGTEVIAIIEKLGQITGLVKNKSLYIDSHNIPVIANCTITALHGEERLEAVSICNVDGTGKPDFDSEKIIECDTLITSVGLIPELEIIRNLNLNFSGNSLDVADPPSTSIPNLFICGNAHNIHSIVDTVVAEGTLAGELAADYILNQQAI